MLAKLAWKNIWRNKVRSGVILGAIAIGLFSGTYLVAFMEGWVVGSVQDEIDTNLSHIQVHDSGFLVNYDISRYYGLDLQSFPFLEDSCLSRNDELLISKRIVLSGMLASANNAVGIRLKGVYPDEEKAVSTVWKTIPDSLGVFLPGDAKMPIVISRKTAEKLKVKLKSKIVFTFQDASETMQSVAFRVSGIYKTSNSMFDENTVFVRYDDIFPLTALPEGAVHEAAIRVVALDATPLQAADEICPEIKAALPNLDIQSWKELSPTLSVTMQWTGLYSVIILGIFLLALSFGIINTMLMAVLERTKELGMLGAIGMSKAKIFRMILLETVFLTLLGSIAGVILAIAVLVPTLQTGIDLSFMMGDTFEDYGYSSIVYPVISLKMIIDIVAMVVVAGILSAIYPAIKALKLKPLEAIRS
jgi:ABC-type lipoprotein release transport system permease subunit